MEPTSEERKIEIGPEILNSLNSTRKWTTFLAVLGFIFLGLLIIAGLATSLFLTTFNTTEANLGIPDPFIYCYRRHLFFSCIFSFPFFKEYAGCYSESGSAEASKGIQESQALFHIYRDNGNCCSHNLCSCIAFRRGINVISERHVTYVT
jgi:hypothetical protein